MADESDNVRGPAAPSAFIDDLVALIGGAELEASNWVAEFDWIVKIRPHNVDAAHLEVMIGPESQVVVHAPGLFWWTFGSQDSVDEDGTGPAWVVIEQLVKRGGVIERSTKTSQLTEVDGRLVSGPHHNGGVRPRERLTSMSPYRTTP